VYWRKILREDTRKVLKLFVEKAHKLLALPFTKFLEEQGSSIGYSWSAKESVFTVHQSFPSDDEIDAFVLTLRLFMQKSSSISFPALAERSLNDPELSDDWKRSVVSSREAFNRYLDTYSDCLLEINGFSPKPRQVMDIFINGDLAHVDPKYRAVFEDWRSDPIKFAFVKMDLIGSFQISLQCISPILYYTEKELL
jgi:hypothetical protein